MSVIALMLSMWDQIWSCCSHTLFRCVGLKLLIAQWGWYTPNNECWGGGDSLQVKTQFCHNNSVVPCPLSQYKRGWCCFCSWIFKAHSKGPGVPFSRLIPGIAGACVTSHGIIQPLHFCLYRQLLFLNSYLKTQWLNPITLYLVLRV